MNVALAPQRRAWADPMLVLLILGYLTMTRSFAHIGVRPIYLGELTLLIIALAYPHAMLAPWFGAMLTPNRLSLLAWSIFVLAVYGVLQCVRGMIEGKFPVVALQNLMFSVYPVLVLCGVWVGVRRPELLRRLVYWLAWLNGLYGLFYLTLGPYVEPHHPLEIGMIAIFGQPSGEAMAMLGLICFEKNMRRVWAPLLLNTFVLLGMQVRAEWLGFTISLLLWAYLKGRLGQLCKLATVAVVLLIVGLITDAKIPSSSTHAGEISTRFIVGRAIAAVSPKAASTIMGYRAAESWGSTISWRTGWWKSLWALVHQDPLHAVFGASYGYPIWRLHPEGVPEIIRSPHNVFMYALTYTGWLGVVLFYTMQLSLGWLLWLTYRRTGQPFGICLWLMVVIWAVFDNFLEAPYGAIPIYLLCGLAIAPLFTPQTRTVQPTGPEPDNAQGSWP